MRNVLITGGGFIGSRLFTHLSENHPEIEKLVFICGSDTSQLCHSTKKVDRLYLNLIELRHLHSVLRNYNNFDTVFHTAGIAKVSAPLTDIFPANLQTTVNLLECVEGARFIFTSSSTVYGNGHRKIDFDEYDKLQPTSAYGASKVACESFIDAYTRLGRINGVNLRLCANVGPGATHGLLKDLIHKVKSDSETLELFGDAPGSIKPFIHVDDTVRAMVWFAEENTKGGAWNVCPKDTLTVSEVADLVMEQVGKQKEKVWLGEGATWAGDNKEFSMCNKKLNRAGFRLQHNTSKGAVVQAIKENL
jgi:UDP-glucose 4-epimerase